MLYGREHSLNPMELELFNPFLGFEFNGFLGV